jgi:hypothetical protein
MFMVEEEAVEVVCLLHLLFFLEDGVTVVVGTLVPDYTALYPTE